MKLPALKPLEVVRVLKKLRFYPARQEGSHLVMKNDNQKTVVIPIHNKDMRKGLLLSIIKSAGMSQEEFLALL
jgi:predicted RNA binding protein YcfA (HicA-like mRNA interferase family)